MNRSTRPQPASPPGSGRAGLSDAAKALIERRRKAGSLPEAAPPQSIPRRRTGGPAPLSFAQERLWFLEQLEPGGAAYNIFSAVRWTGRLSLPALAAALDEVVRRHESLRTRFVAAGELGTVQVADPHHARPLPQVDLSGLPGTRLDVERDRLMTAEARAPFDLSRGPLLRTRLLRLAAPASPGGEQHLLLATVHHIVSDGWSQGLFLHELVTLYRAAVAGSPSPLPELPIQYADYAVWQREWLSGPKLAEQLAYWRRQLADAPAMLELPGDRPRPPRLSFRGGREALELPPGLVDGLKALARQEQASLFMVMLVGFTALLHRYSGQEDLSVGTPVAGRGRVETERLIGFFVNTLVLRTRLNGDPEFGELLRRSAEAALAAFTHQDVPFEKLVEDLRPERALSRSPLFQVMLILQNAPTGDVAIGDLSLGLVPFEAGSAKFDLTLSLAEHRNGSLAARLEYSSDLYDRATAARLLGHLEILLAGVVAAPEVRLSALPLLTVAEREQLVAWSRTAPRNLGGLPVHRLVELQAERTPAAVALKAEMGGERELTYRELERRANRLARHLRGLGVGPEVLVGLAVERSPAMVVGLLGVLKAGGAYVPLDPSQPRERLAMVLGDSGARVLVTEEPVRAALPETDAAVVCLDADWERISRLADDPVEVACEPESLAYAIFTSGSTGRPKGVLIPHRALTNFLLSMLREPGFAACDALLAVTTLSFDIAGLELYLPLTAGGHVVVAGRETAADASRLMARLAAGDVTVMQATPATWRMLLDAGWTGDRSLRVLCGGEALPTELAGRLGAAVGELWNVYGPTETTVWSAARRVAPGESPVRVGGPIANTSLSVVDRELEPQPVGIPGELLIGGAGLARGYLGRPELTAERFIPDPFAGEPGARLYRTGDLVRWRPDGSLEFLGRIDHQVKVRGFRIEPGEIEAVLHRHPLVEDAVVVAREDGGERRLVAYVVPQTPVDGRDAPPGRLYGAFLREHLPDYMIPSAFVVLASLPRNANGKIDRKALPAPEAGAAVWAHEHVTPRNAVEELLAEIWAEVLRVERVGVHDDFFALGGHSLLATQIASRVRAVFRVELPLRRLFEAPTIAALAGTVGAALSDQRAPGPPPLVALPREPAGATRLPLSYAQERLWFLQQLDVGSAAYNMPLAIRWGGRLEVGTLAAILSEIAGRHEALRTRFEALEGEATGAMQVVEPAAPGSLPVVDLAGMPEAARAAESARLIREEAQRPFDLARGPVLRTWLLRSGNAEHALLATVHHIASDGWSQGLFLRELTALYEAFAAGRPSPLPELPIQYADYAAWQREWLSGEVLESQLAFWRERLAGAPPVLALPTDRPRPPVQSFRGGREARDLPAELAGAVKALARGERASLFMVLLAGFGALLSRYSGQEDLCVGTPVAGRARMETERLIGLFVNTLVLRARLDGDPTVRQLVGRSSEAALAAFAHQDVPFEKLVEDLRPERALSRSPLFQVMLILQNAPTGDVAIGDLALGLVPFEAGSAKFDLTLSLAEHRDGSLAARLEYSSDLYDRATAARLLGHLETLLAGAVAAPEARLSELPLLSPAEERQLLVEWNRTASGHPHGLCLHELFESQAARTPEAAALVTTSESLTYRELDDRATRLARHLERLGVRPESLVAVCSERNSQMVVGLLATLKAGGAYVPLDPGHPRERLAFMLEDAGASVVLTQTSLLDRLPQGPAHVVCLDAWQASAADEGPPAGPGPTPENLAYAIYTSGSTGRPKGVAIAHRSAVAFLGWARGAFPPDDLQGVFGATSICFDLSVFELFAPLACGGKVVLGDDALALAELPAAMAAEVTLINTVPSAIAELLRLGAVPPSVRTVNLAGEPLRKALVERIYELPTVDRVLNLYGPSEDTTYSTFTVVPRAGDGEPTIGRPIADTRAYVLDRHRRPLPVGVPGELCLGGAGLARGYLGQPALTAEKFVPDPFGAEPGGRLYRTGDLARFQPGGEIEFLGRIDHQVKVRGFRIELGEIESVLHRHPLVEDAVVVAREDGGERRLVAYVVPQTPADGRDAPPRDAPPGRLYGAVLREHLPDYMIPSAFVVLASLPRNANGKIDRKALPAPEAGAAVWAHEHVAPRTAVEELLAEIWAEVLRLERVSVHDDFFALGGHSLLATQVASRVRGVFRVELPLRRIFEAPTVAALAEAVGAAAGADRGREAPPLVALPRDPAGATPLPLSYGQERLWFLDQFEPGGSALNIATTVRLSGCLSVPALAAGVGEVVRRHESLRTAFAPADQGIGAVQVVSPAVGAPAAVPLVDLCGLPAPVCDTETGRLARREAARPFDLARGPLLRLTLLRRAAEEHLLLLTMHHIVSDGWSVSVFFSELAALYGAALTGRPSPLPAPPVQYGDFAVWQREWLQGEVLAGQLAYWRERLAGAPPLLELPTDRLRPAVQTFRGGRHTLVLPQDLSHDLRSLGRRHGATLFMTLLAAFKILLARHSGQEDVVVGSPIAGRGRAEVERLIGFFINSLVLRTDLSGRPRFRELLERVREEALGAFAHQDVPFEKLLEELAPPRDLAHTPLFQVYFNVLNFFAGEVRLPGLTLASGAAGEAVSKFDLTLYVAEREGRIGVTWVYNADLFDAPRIAAMAGQLEHLLRQAVADPEAAIGEYDLVTPEARAVLPDPAAPLSARWEGSVAERFTAMAARFPERPAVSDPAESWTYRELDLASNRLADRLRSGGVGRGDFVAVWAHRSAPLVWALLGIVKSGAAFVMLDPAYPALRLVDVLRLAQPKGFLRLAAAGPLPEPLGAWLAEAGAVCLDLPRKADLAVRDPLAGASAAAPRVEIGPDDVAYAAFTSGSTGVPKGILGRHGSLSHFIPWQVREFGLSERDRFSLLSGLAHDPLHRDVFTPLQIGAAVAVPDPERIGDPGWLAAWMRREEVTVAHLTPAMGQLLAGTGEDGDTRVPSLRWAFLVGDVLTRRDVERLEALAPSLTSVNYYGSTETQRAVGYHVARRGSAGGSGRQVLPLGSGIADVQLLVLTRERRLAGIGELGEIAVRSPHLALGYLGDPSLTADRFVANPLGASADPRDRLYRTGDLGRYLPDGQAVFAGRADHQVKIRGFRIEPGEIEAVLGRHPAVKEAVVVAREVGGEKRLVAYVVPRAAAGPGDAPPGRLYGTYLREHLPEHMVPAVFVTLAALPLTPNRKVDRAALPDPELPAAEEDYVAPRTAAEDLLAEIWAEVLRIQPVGVRDNFFALGGHSLLAAQVVSRVRQALQLDLPLRSLFEAPTIERLAVTVEDLCLAAG